MYNRYSALVLRWLKVPPEPHPPFGDPASLRVFRAGRNYYKLRMFGWGVAEFFAFAAIVFWAFVFVTVEETARIEKQRRAASAQVVTAHKATLAEQAKQADTSLRRGRILSPLHGVPFGAKDLFDTKDIPTTWGAQPRLIR